MWISPAQTSDYSHLTEIWEASVRATHHFLSEADIAYFKPRVQAEFLPALELAVARDAQGHIVGFIGVAGQKIEMLFIHPTFRGLGIGRLLVDHALKNYDATSVDVNEQNEQAVGFYQRLGFCVQGRSPLDGMGKPFPLLHMKIRQSESASKM
jgi:putative acetyltransferase